MYSPPPPPSATSATPPLPLQCFLLLLYVLNVQPSCVTQWLWILYSTKFIRPLCCFYYYFEWLFSVCQVQSPCVTRCPEFCLQLCSSSVFFISDEYFLFGLFNLLVLHGEGKVRASQDWGVTSFCQVLTPSNRWNPGMWINKKYQNISP